MATFTIRSLSAAAMLVAVATGAQAQGVVNCAALMHLGAKRRPKNSPKKPVLK